MLRGLLTAAIVVVLATPALAERVMSIRGMTLAHMHRGGDGYGSEACRGELDKLAALGVNWVALCEFAYMERVNEPAVRSRGGDRDEAMRRTIADAHARGIQVMLKPHLWSRDFGNGVDWHGTIAMDDEVEWAAFFENYTAYILDQARLAQETGADGLCIGVEMKLTTGRESDWRKLIAAVREVYDGPLTYSANSDEWQNIAWWDAVDAIGITAYFPLSEVRPADEAALRAGWARVYDQLEPFARRFGKSIVFTELGYTRSANAAAAPWEHHEEEPADPAYQALLYRVALEEAAQRDFVGGVFAWKWFSADLSNRTGGREAFLIQNRPLTLDVFRGAWAPQAAPENSEPTPVP